MQQFARNNDLINHRAFGRVWWPIRELPFRRYCGSPVAQRVIDGLTVTRAQSHEADLSRVVLPLNSGEQLRCEIPKLAADFNSSFVLSVESPVAPDFAHRPVLTKFI